MRSNIFLLLLLFTTVSIAQNKINDFLFYDGTVRTGFHTITRYERDGSESSTDDFRLRLQLGLGANITNTLSAKVRFAGRFSTEQENFLFTMKDHIPTTDGLRLGESTFDQIYLSYKPFSDLNIRLGRFQTKFELVGVPRKSLERSDSPNTDVSWTDGLHLTYTLPIGFNTHFILQHNSEKGPTNVNRSPLRFTDKGSRFTYYGLIESNKKWGPFIQREFSVTYIPKSFLSYGIYKDYIAYVTRLGMSFDLDYEGGRFVVGGEAGYAPNTPPKTAFRTGKAGDGDAGGWAYQLSFNLMDLFNDHNIGIVYGVIDDGWLISPDLRNNNIEFETRYIWKISNPLSFEGRGRVRKDYIAVDGSQQQRKHVDFYFRFTYRL